MDTEFILHEQRNKDGERAFKRMLFFESCLRTMSTSPPEWLPGHANNPVSSGILEDNTCVPLCNLCTHLLCFRCGSVSVCVCDFMLIRHPSLSQFQTDPAEICKSCSSHCSVCGCSILWFEPLVKGRLTAARPDFLVGSASLGLEAF